MVIDVGFVDWTLRGGSKDVRSIDWTIYCTIGGKAKCDVLCSSFEEE